MANGRKSNDSPFGLPKWPNAGFGRPRAIGGAREEPFPVVDDLPAHFREPLNRIHSAWRWHRLRSLTSMVYYVLVFLVAGWGFSQVIDREIPVISHVAIGNPPIAAGGLPAVARGGRLLMIVHVERLRVCESDIKFYLYDGQDKETIIALPHAYARGNLGPEDFKREIRLPNDAELGRGRLRIVRSYQCPGNYLHELKPIDDISKDMAFEIVASSPINPR